VFGKREFRLTIDELKNYECLKMMTVTKDGEEQTWFDDDHNVDQGAIKQGKNQKVNLEQQLAIERGSLFIVLKESDKMTVGQMMSIKLAIVGWRYTSFWKIWSHLAYSLPLMTLITMVTNHLIHIRKDVIKQHRYANHHTRLTSAQYGGGNNHKIE